MVHSAFDIVRPHRCRIVWLTVVLIWWAAASMPRPALAESREYSVKAAYLLNFVRYTSWPDESFRTADEPIVICVAGTDRYGGIFERTMRNRLSRGRPVELRWTDANAGELHCDLLYIPGKKDSASLRKRLPAGSHALTVGESPGFLAAGGMIRFLVQNDTVQFEVNAAAAESAGLRIEPAMLELAAQVQRSDAAYGRGETAP